MNHPDSNSAAKSDAKNMRALDQRRHMKDKVVNGLIASGGVFVLVAIVSIFFYLLSVSWPLFFGSGAEKHATLKVNQAALVSIDEYSEVGYRFMPTTATFSFFKVKTGEPVNQLQVSLPEGVAVQSVKRGPAVDELLYLGLTNGGVLAVKPVMEAQGLGELRQYAQSLEYPWGESPLMVSGSPLNTFTVFDEGSDVKVAYVEAGELKLSVFDSGSASGSGMGLMLAAPTEEEQGYELSLNETLAGNAVKIQSLEISQGSRWLYAVSQNGFIDVMASAGQSFAPYQHIETGSQITASIMLQGRVSLVVGNDTGTVSQWFMVSDQDGNDTLTKIRSFKLGDSPIVSLAAEKSRKGVLAGDTTGEVGYFYTTSERSVFKEDVGPTAVVSLAMSSHGDGLLVAKENQVSFFDVAAKHPEVSVSSLWQPVWYESYPEPDYVWQSSSGSSDFEPKMSLVPLTFGTLKAAFWAMIISAPLAIGCAIYTAVFMSPALRTKVKPALELMEALPTVILGFLAGLWLAPLVNQHLPFVFSLLVVLPAVILLTGFAWMQLPLERRNAMPQGIAPLVILAPMLIGCFIAFYSTEAIESAVFKNFDGSLVTFLRDPNNGLGIDYQDQNALIVGLMMGFAVIPTIFSITEDALFAVPRHLTNGSLALGATPWQTLTRVVLPTASPGIFSALMIGLGRAVGETMIVLMATGNTPIMDLSLFNGMRTLSANVAVEMGEAEVGSSHFRVLFLSALVLFILTFAVNTVAETVRTRLRKKYGSL